MGCNSSNVSCCNTPEGIPPDAERGEDKDSPPKSQVQEIVVPAELQTQEIVGDRIEPAGTTGTAMQSADAAVDEDVESNPNLEASDAAASASDVKVTLPSGVQSSTISDELPQSMDDVTQSPKPFFADLDDDTRAKLLQLLKDHDIFAAYEICPDYVEAEGYMQTYRRITGILCDKGQQKWEKTITGDLKDGDQWQLQYCWDGETPGAGGKEYLWVKLSIDQGIEWWKQLGSFHEPDLDMKTNSLLVDAFMIGQPTATHAIRCNIQSLLGKMFGCTQEYLEVRRFINKETGFCIEYNVSVENEELKKRGLDPGKMKYKKGTDMLLYIISFPRSATKCTAVLYTRAKLHLPGWMVSKFVSSVGPYMVRTLLPKMIEQQKSNPEYQARFAEDKAGFYAEFKDFTAKGVDEAQNRKEKYGALNLPPSSAVMGRFAQP